MKEGGSEKETNVETNPMGWKRIIVNVYVPWLAQTHQYAAAGF